MSTNKTSNLGLHSWVRSDKFSMDEFNENFNKLDKAVGENSTAAKTEAQTRESAVSALTKAVAKCGNCRVVFSTYQGTGIFGYDKPTSKSFDGKPLLVIVCDVNNGTRLTMVQGCNPGIVNTSTGNYSVALTWAGNTVSWASNHVDNQLNNSSRTYQVMAFIAADEEK